MTSRWHQEISVICPSLYIRKSKSNPLWVCLCVSMSMCCRGMKNVHHTPLIQIPCLSTFWHNLSLLNHSIVSSPLNMNLPWPRPVTLHLSVCQSVRPSGPLAFWIKHRAFSLLCHLFNCSFVFKCLSSVFLSLPSCIIFLSLSLCIGGSARKCTAP